jgi:DNA replication and repair protein RecF
LELDAGLILVVGPNGAGKTNLLEALHVGTQGFSPRTRRDRELIRFGERSARIALAGRRGPAELGTSIVFSTDAARRASLNRAVLGSAEQLRREIHTLVFTPDRLAVVKGGPAARRAYFDRVLARLLPARSSLPADYAASLAQRNAALRFSTPAAVEPWTAQVASLGASLVEARRETVAALATAVAGRAGELELPNVEMTYEGESPTLEELERRLPRDRQRGTTSLGPHLDDVRLASGTRDLRSYGSQGEQRIVVLALLLAEAELLRARHGIPPLLLLDDVLSELDAARRRTLAASVAGAGQTLVTATDATFLPTDPAQLVAVTPGEARSV